MCTDHPYCKALEEGARDLIESFEQRPREGFGATFDPQLPIGAL